MTTLQNTAECGRKFHHINGRQGFPGSSSDRSPDSRNTFNQRLYFERDEEEAREFIERLIHFLEPPARSQMLDAACGRGRHSRILAEMQFDVTGIDLSFKSIEYANQLARKDSLQEKGNLHFYQHDIRLPFWINYFDYAFNFFTSFGYFATRREHDDAMRTVAA